jgi:XTP/dITP diphosphohydrolase
MQNSLIDIVFATNNPNKVKEVNAILAENQVSINLKTLSEMNILEDIIEDGNTLEENAAIKSNFIFKKFGFNAIGEDTGLEVDVLNGAPGVHTARYAGNQKSPDDNMEKLLASLLNKENRSAQFRTVINLILDGDTYEFEGIVRGKIANQKSGKGGFGYDPIFIPEGYDKTFAELDKSIKNKISHRAIATKKLISFLKER